MALCSLNLERDRCGIAVLHFRLQARHAEKPEQSRKRKPVEKGLEVGLARKRKVTTLREKWTGMTRKSHLKLCRKGSSPTRLAIAASHWDGKALQGNPMLGPPDGGVPYPAVEPTMRRRNHHHENQISLLP